MTKLKYGTVETYHLFKVLKKDQTQKLIIFYALGDIDKRIKQCEEDGTSISCSTLDEQYPSKVESLCRGGLRPPPAKKLQESLFDAMSSPKQRRVLYSKPEIPKDQKGLGYLHQVAMITISPSKAPCEPQKGTKRMDILKKTIVLT